MQIHNPWHRSSALTFWLGLAGVPIGLAVGLLAGTQPSLLGLGLVAVAVVVYFFARFEQAVLGLLILRSCLDPFSDQQVPAAFAMGLNGLTLLYVTVMLLRGQTVRTDKFWWFFAGWVMLQGLWVILLPLGGLGLDASFLLESIREWIRLFSWLMVYLLVMQLKGRIPPKQVVYGLFWALLLPVTVALLQMFVPSVLPPFFAPHGGHSTGIEEVSRIKGTLGHPNTFVTFVLLFMGLTYWRLTQSKQGWPWLLLLGLLAFLYVSTKSLFGLMMLGTFIVALIAPRLSLVNLIGGIVVFVGIIILFGSSEFGQERLGSIAQTPLGNPDIDIWRAILLSKGDSNSFNWRIAQWTYLLGQWQKFPILGYGLGISADVSTNGLYPHNDYIRALVEGGIVGLGTLFIFLGGQVVRLLQLYVQAPRGSGQRELSLALLAFLLAIPVGMITENIWTHTTMFFYWWTLLAVAGWNWNEQETGKNKIVGQKTLNR
ncbi:MAG: O-antigen ligase family protein [Moorea sp. SIO4A3]|nr:O-antigen ligase family protein [Moorena sp. SIO4A3]